jgi:tRNA (mo5U34)-methyltransferase
VDASEILAIPTEESPRRLRSRLASHDDYFYKFTFSNGVATDGPDAATNAVHETRARLVLPWLDALIGSRWSKTRCVDLACNQGWFSMQLAARGASSVLGVDVRSDHIETARAIADVSETSNITFRRANLFDLTSDELGTFDVTLFLGVLYHLDSPLQALRVVRDLTEGICVLETQVARASEPIECLWGSGPPLSGPAVAVVPSDEHHVQGGRDIVLVPSLDALVWMMYAVGFKHVSVTAPARTAFDQFVQRDRVVLLALT